MGGTTARLISFVMAVQSEKASFLADYTLSRLLTFSAYYDLQTNTPLLSSSSYPTTTHDFGVSLKFSLTR